MKRCYLLVMTVVALIVLMVIPVNAAETDDFDYSEFFARSLTVDGFYADVYASELTAVYNQDASAFLENLSYEDEKIIDNVAYLLVYDQYFCEYEQFKSYITAELANTDSSAPRAAVLDAIRSYIELFDEANSGTSECLPPPEADAFHVETVRGFIDSWLELNMEAGDYFYNTIAGAYAADPILFSDMVSDLNENAIDILGQGIAGALNRLGMTAVADETTLLTTVVSEALTKTEIDMLPEMEILVPPESEAEPLVTYYSPQPSVSSMQYTSGTFQVGETVSLNVVLSETKNLSLVRQYGIQVYTEREGAMVFLTPVQVVTMSPGSTSISANFSYELTEAELFETFVRITNPSTGTAVYSMRMSQTHDVTGQWSITVELTADRAQLGTITLYDASGDVMSQSVCLGRSASNIPMELEYGHTPIGIYTGVLNGTRADTSAYGQYQVIWIQGTEGYVVEKCSDRDGLLIHGGRESVYAGLEPGDPGFRLAATNGCVRVMGEYQLQLENEITYLTENYHDEVGEVTVTQDGLTTLGD